MTEQHDTRRSTAKSRLAGALHQMVTGAGALVLGLMASACAATGEADPLSGPRLESAALATLGDSVGDELVDVVGAVLIHDTVIVADRNSATLRMYDASGRLMKVIGGRGRGPGEFMGLTWIQRVGDRLFAYDRGQSRLTEFTTAGVLVGSASIAPPKGFTSAEPMGVFADGSVLVWASIRGPRANTPRVVRVNAALFRANGKGAYVDSLTAYLGPEMFVQPFGRGGEIRSVLPFGRQSAVAAGPAGYYVIQNSGDTISGFTASGKANGTFQMPGAFRAQTVGENDVVAARKRFVKGETMELRLGPVFDKMTLPTTFPAYGWGGGRRHGILKVATTGDVWALQYGGIRNDRPTWLVFRQDGTLRGRVGSLDEVDLLDASDGVAVVLCWGRDDEQRVELRRITW